MIKNEKVQEHFSRDAIFDSFFQQSSFSSRIRSRIFYCFLIRIKLHVSYTIHTHVVHPYTYLYVVSFPRVYLRIYICKCDLKKTIKIGRQHSYILYNSVRNIKPKEIFFRQTVHRRRQNTCVWYRLEWQNSLYQW